VTALNKRVAHLINEQDQKEPLVELVTEERASVPLRLYESGRVQPDVSALATGWPSEMPEAIEVLFDAFLFQRRRGLSPLSGRDDGSPRTADYRVWALSLAMGPALMSNANSRFTPSDLARRMSITRRPDDRSDVRMECYYAVELDMMVLSAAAGTRQGRDMLQPQALTFINTLQSTSEELANLLPSSAKPVFQTWAKVLIPTAL